MIHECRCDERLIHHTDTHIKKGVDPLKEEKQVWSGPCRDGGWRAFYQMTNRGHPPPQCLRVRVRVWIRKRLWFVDMILFYILIFPRYGTFFVLQWELFSWRKNLLLFSIKNVTWHTTVRVMVRVTVSWISMTRVTVPWIYDTVSHTLGCCQLRGGLEHLKVETMGECVISG